MHLSMFEQSVQLKKEVVNLLTTPVEDAERILKEDARAFFDREVKNSQWLRQQLANRINADNPLSVSEQDMLNYDFFGNMTPVIRFSIPLSYGHIMS